ncbi:uncharacterized protein TRAVEDRAFT_48182 [Trametes versicolor FP-101664 SS1]|uniref:uncharacterized protein n=1 Tax=Trametes versicolor (strain FP-101664) TaxID=717944 RepID=UPI00046247F5|nr:uncharacterized protein TRAVEDRAFT_48182 [Trametes versicolor FP-101664 SS1]EIW57128.1 hypothetical protein TRAVEDRAFT_48182 [Trametes versicolor FP-101664 SS1]
MASQDPTQENTSDAISVHTTRRRPSRIVRLQAMAPGGHIVRDRPTAEEQHRRNPHEIIRELMNATVIGTALSVIPSVAAPYIGAALIADNSQRGTAVRAAFRGSLVVGLHAGLVGHIIYRHPNMPELRDLWRHATPRERIWIGANLTAALAFVSTAVGLVITPGRSSPNALEEFCDSVSRRNDTFAL